MRGGWGETGALRTGAVSARDASSLWVNLEPIRGFETDVMWKCGGGPNLAVEGVGLDDRESIAFFRIGPLPKRRSWCAVTRKSFAIFNTSSVIVSVLSDDSDWVGRE
jgi:hypothetical protein